MLISLRKSAQESAYLLPEVGTGLFGSSQRHQICIPSHGVVLIMFTTVNVRWYLGNPLLSVRPEKFSKSEDVLTQIKIKK